MGCKECGKPKCNGKCGCKSPKVLQINNPAEYITFHKVSIPAAMGDSTTNPPKIGAYRNALVYYEADHTSWMYSTDGIPTLVTGEQGETGPQGPAGTVAVGTTTTGKPGTQARVYNSGTDSNAVLNFEIPRGDVGPSVPLAQETGNSTTKAMSQNATTEALNGKQNTLTAGSNIQISGSTISATDTKYSAGNGITLTGTQFSANTSVLATKNDLGSYYTKTQIDSQMAAKQDDLVAGSNIQIENGTISATDTTYTAGNGLNLNGTEFSADTDVLAAKEDLEGYYTKPEADNLLAPKLEAEVVAELPTTGTEGKLYLTPKTHTIQPATGNPITTTVAEEAGQLESFQLDGDTFQQTYTGKNLYYDTDGFKQGFIGNNGAIVSSAESVSNATYIKASGNTQYVMSFNDLYGGTTFRGVGCYDSNKDFIERIPATAITNGSFQTVADTAYIRVYFYNSNGLNAANFPTNYINNIQIESGATASSYEPFVGGQPSPSPDYPQPIQTVTGEQTVTVVGKNLFNDATAINSYIQSNGSVTPNDVWRASQLIKVSPNTSYIWHGEVYGVNQVVWAGYDSGSAFVSGQYKQVNSAPSLVIVTGVNTEYIRVGYRGDGMRNMQLELGSTASAYTPYSSTDYPISLGSIELCKLGTYQDYIYKDGESWKVHKATVSAIIDGSESWSTSGTNTFYVADIYSKIGNSIQSASTGEMYASHFTIVDISGSNTLVGASLKVDAAHSVSNLRIRLQDMSGGTAGFRQMLSAKKPSIYARRLTPTDTTITDSNLIAQLEAIRTASLQNGTNTITNTATGSNLAGDMEIGYFETNPTNRYDKFIWLDLNNNYEQIGG